MGVGQGQGPRIDVCKDPATPPSNDAGYRVLSKQVAKLVEGLSIIRGYDAHRTLLDSYQGCRRIWDDAYQCLSLESPPNERYPKDNGVVCQQCRTLARGHLDPISRLGEAHQSSTRQE